MKTLNLKNLKRFREFTLAGLVRYTIMKFRKQQLLVTGSCKCCGKCCNKLSLDDGTGWLRKKTEFQAIVERSPEYNCFIIIGYDDSGIIQFRCSHLREDGKCSNYGGRFNFCRDFPDKNLVFSGGCLPRNCGYHIKPVIPFNTILKETIEKSNEKSPHS